MNDVVWTEPALQDLDDIAAYIAKDSPRSAEKITRRIVETIAALGYHTHLGRNGQIEATRELVVSGTPYIAVYRIGLHIEILTIYHAARQWPPGDLT